MDIVGLAGMILESWNIGISRWNLSTTRDLYFSFHFGTWWPLQGGKAAPIEPQKQSFNPPAH